jgi:AcrR family transcriptional regulator
MPSKSPPPSAATPAEAARAGRRSQQERRDHAEKALLDAASVLFARRGVDQTSLADIGEESGFSRGLVNHHFGSKAALVERLARRSQSHFVELLGDFSSDEADALVALADAYLAMVGGNTDAARAFFVMWGAALPTEAGLRPIFVTDDAQFRFGVESLVRAGQQKKTITAQCDPASVAVVLVGMLRGVSAQFLIDPDGVDMAAARNTCAQFIRHTLAPNASRPGKTRR